MAAGISLLLLLMVVVAQFLTRRIVRPLTDIESQMQQVASGRLERVEFSWQDRELLSLAAAFNHVMSELESRQVRAVQAEKLAALGTMLSGVAHELNNPLSNISTTVQILAEEAAHMSVAETARLVEQIDQQTERARKIVRNLLDYSHEDSDPVRKVGALSIVESAIDAIDHGRQFSRRIMLDGPGELLVPVRVEPMRRALINLLDNAIAATDESDPIVVLVRAVTSADDSTMIEITIQDCGSGLSTVERTHMFDPFFTTKPVGSGTGLGLYITHEIIMQHHGSIEVRSIAGIGTSVILRLPAQIGSVNP
jgi:signal transduction histidine kinase